jgi:hypothetical protein
MKGVMMNEENMSGADFETARMHGVANGLSKARKAGECSHERRQGELHPAANLINSHKPKFKCLDCGKQATWDEMEEDRREILIEWT